MPELATDYDVVVVGSGFGGSVTALRLTEKGYRDPEHGVIEPYHRVYGYPTLSVIDGAAVSANLGVNPSLTIALKPSARQRCGPTKARATSEPSKGRHTAAYHRPRRTTPSCRKARRAHCDSRLSRSRPLARRVRAARKRDDASGSLWPILSRDQASVGVWLIAASSV